jgi:branched-chain amino acid transport system ATP-binding protein
MKAVFGVVKLAAGDVYFQGERISDWPTQRRVEHGIAAVPEGRRVFPSLSIEENLLVGGYVARKAGHAERIIAEMYDLFPRLRERRGQLAGTLSGGEQQMLAIARAMMSQPKIVCMDEPSMGLAPALVKENFSLLTKLRERGVSIFVVEQNAALALKVADYAYVLSSGRVTLRGPADEVAQDEDMKRAYLGGAVAESHDIA